MSNDYFWVWIIMLYILVGDISISLGRGVYSILLDIRPPDILTFFWLMAKYIINRRWTQINTDAQGGRWCLYVLKCVWGRTIQFQSITLDFISLLIYFPAATGEMPPTPSIIMRIWRQRGSIRALRRVAGLWSASRRAWGSRIGEVRQRTGRGCGWYSFYCMVSYILMFVQL